jgi:hypothetical protein
MLAILTNRAKQVGQLSSLVPHLVDGGLSNLQYADDTILFMVHDFEKAVNTKMLLCAFEQLSGLKINFHKSEVYCFGEAKTQEHQYTQLFRCRKGDYLFRYLGLPMHYRKLSMADWKIIKNKFEKKLSSSKGKYMSVGGRLVLINSTLTSLAMFMMSFFEILRGVLEKWTITDRRFFWQAEDNKKKYKLTK